MKSTNNTLYTKFLGLPNGLQAVTVTEEVSGWCVFRMLKTDRLQAGSCPVLELEIVKFFQFDRHAAIEFAVDYARSLIKEYELTFRK